MNKPEYIKLFDELIVREDVLGRIIKDYFFQEYPYKEQLEKLNLINENKYKNWNKELGSDLKKRNEIKALILKNSSKIIFRNKGIIFMGYSNRYRDDFYFVLTTSKQPKNNGFSLYTNKKGKQIYAILNKTYFLNFQREKFLSSKYAYSKNYKKAKYNIYWKYNLLRSMNKEVLNELRKHTNIRIYKEINEEERS